MQKPFTQKDRNKLRKKISMMALLTIAIITIFVFIYSYGLKNFLTKSDGFDYIAVVMFGIFGLFFAGIIGYMAWIFIYDLKNGVKNCFEGIIEDKRLNIKHSSSMRSGAGKSGRKTTTKRSHYIVVNGTEHEIEHQMYVNVSAGDHIYFEVAPKSNVILSYEVLTKTVQQSTRQITRYREGNYPDSKIRETALTPQDKNILKSVQKVQMKSRLRSVLLFGLPIVGLLISGLGSLLIFIFPLPIFFIVQLYKLIKLYLKNKKSATIRRKNLIRTQVTDKSFTTISHNGNTRQKYTLKTTYKSIEVPQIIYEKTEAGNEITIHEAQDIAHIIGISIDEEYFAMV
jgi:hypothetical protein